MKRHNTFLSSGAADTGILSQPAAGLMLRNGALFGTSTGFRLLASRRDSPIKAQGRAQRRQPRSAALGYQAANNGGRGEKHPPNPPFAETAIAGGFSSAVPLPATRNRPRIGSVSADRRWMDAARLDRACSVNPTQGCVNARCARIDLPWALLGPSLRDWRSPQYSCCQHCQSISRGAGWLGQSAAMPQ